MTTFGICQSPPTSSPPFLPSCPSLSLCPPARLPLMDVLYLGWPNHCHREQNLWAFRVGTLINELGEEGAMTGSKWWVQAGGVLLGKYPCMHSPGHFVSHRKLPCPPSPFSAMQIGCRLNPEWRVRYELFTHLWNGQMTKRQISLMLSMKLLGIHSTGCSSFCCC